MNVTVVGAGYVGLANAVLLSQQHQVTLHDIDSRRIKKITNKKSPIEDGLLQEYLSTKNLTLTATTDSVQAYIDANYVIIAAPTNYDPEKNYFDTSIVETIIGDIININPSARIVIKSTVPVGFTAEQQLKHPEGTIIFSPEFLREGNALLDNLYPSRIVVGGKSSICKEFADILQTAAEKRNIPKLITGPTEAEAIKLFANTYLAMRVSFFNELDTYAELKGLSSAEIIAGVSTDPRIGDYYNNPSFGYGGYCLPKDTKQLRANFSDIPSNLMHAIVESNETRIAHIAQAILKLKPTSIGIYRLAMKSGSDNFRESAIRRVIDILRLNNCKILLYEPVLATETFENMKVIPSFHQFAELSDFIVANRITEELNEFMHKVYSRDIFSRD